MQIPKQIYFKQASPRGSKLIATVDGNDLPNLIQIKGTNDISDVKRKRERVRSLEVFGGNHRDNDDDRRNDDDDDDEDFRDNNGCHKNTTGVWESKNKYTSLKQTLLFIKRFRCKRVIQIGNYDAQGKLIVETPAAVIKDQSIAFAEGAVELKWTSVTEVQLKEYSSEFKLPNSTVWEKFDSDLPIGANTLYTATDYPTTPGAISYRLKALFNDNTERELLAQTVTVALSAAPIAEVSGFLVTYDGATFVSAQWSSKQEVSLDYYKLEKKTPTGTDFVATEVPEVTQQGPSDYGPVLDLPGDGPGIYAYRLVAVFTDKTSKVVATFLSITI